jgi:hypothetical protein
LHSWWFWRASELVAGGSVKILSPWGPGRREHPLRASWTRRGPGARALRKAAPAASRGRPAGRATVLRAPEEPRRVDPRPEARASRLDRNRTEPRVATIRNAAPKCAGTTQAECGAAAKVTVTCWAVTAIRAASALVRRVRPNFGMASRACSSRVSAATRIPNARVEIALTARVVTRRATACASTATRPVRAWRRKKTLGPARRPRCARPGIAADCRTDKRARTGALANPSTARRPTAALRFVATRRATVFARRAARTARATTSRSVTRTAT